DHLPIATLSPEDAWHKGLPEPQNLASRPPKKATGGWSSFFQTRCSQAVCLGYHLLRRPLSWAPSFAARLRTLGFWAERAARRSSPSAACPMRFLMTDLASR